MLIKKEHLDQITENYSKTHNAYEVMGFVDGLIAMLQIIDDNDSLQNNKQVTNQKSK